MREIAYEKRLSTCLGCLLVLLIIGGPIASAQLSGTIHVGAAQLPPFNTLSGAVSQLNTNGTAAPGVTFLLDDASYTITSTLNINVSSSPPDSTKPVIFKPNTGVTSTISGSVSGGNIFKIFSTNWVTIDGSNTTNGTTRDLTITNTNTNAGSSAVYIASGGTTTVWNITVKNCIISNGSTFNTGAAVLISDGNTIANPGFFNRIVIQNNNIQRAVYGVYVNGLTGSATQNALNVRILNNTMNASGTNALRQYGVYMFGVNNASISKNDIGFIDPTTDEVDAGIAIAGGVINATVDSNNIHDLAYTGSNFSGPKGIGLNTGLNNVNIMVDNNMISNITGNGDSLGVAAKVQDSPAGIYLGPGTQNGLGQTGISLYYNSINLFGNTINKAGAYSYGIGLEVGTANVVNNIIINKLGLLGSVGSGTVGLYAQTKSQFGTVDYNDYNCGPTIAPNYIGKIGTTNYVLLSDFRTAAGGNTHSDSVDVTFASPTDLHLAGGSVGDHNLLGTPITGITTDYDGQLRNSTYPYMGADEVLGFPLPVSLVSFTAQPDQSGRNVKLQWTTLTEVNNYGFNIQRRPDSGPLFSDLQGAFVPGHGTTIQVHQYSYVDESITSPGIYEYRLRQTDLDGTIHFSDPMQVNLTVLSVAETAPLHFALMQNYPNPFNPSTNISYDLGSTVRVSLKLYDVLGREVVNLVDAVQTPGRHQVTLDASTLASGVYVYRLQAGTYVASKKIALVR